MPDFARRGPPGLKPDRAPADKKPSRLPRVSKKKKAAQESPDGRLAAQYVKLVKTLPCAITGKHGPSDAHHTICGRFGARKESDWLVIPLCKELHQDGPEAIHNGKESWVAKHGPDTDYIIPTMTAVIKILLRNR